MPVHKTKLGEVIVDSKDNLLRRAALIAEEVWAHRPRFSWALSGGSTPKEFYRMCAGSSVLLPDLVAACVWTVSDERCVPLADSESNFGNAERLLLAPLGAKPEGRVPWPVALPPQEAAAAYSRDWARRFGKDAAYDLCFVGMGDDSHTLSLFPGSPLLAHPGGTLFAAIEVPGKGWRLTLTPEGLARCGRVVVLAPGAGKADALRRALFGPDDPLHTPVQLFARMRERVTWLIDEPAAAGLVAS
jgi:6-phosphogluconolactonase